MKKTISFSLILFFVFATAVKSHAQESLYKRLGGYDAIAAVTDDFITRLATDKTLSRFFVASSDDTKKKIRQHIVDQLCNVTGGPCFYMGRTMKDAHQGMKITESDWTITVQLLTATLNKFNVPAKEQGEFMAIAASVKKDIVEVK